MKTLIVILGIWFTFLGFGLPGKFYGYKRIDHANKLQIRFLETPEPAEKPKPCAILLSGGGWLNFGWTQHDALGHVLLDNGIVPVVVEYRTQSEYKNSTPMDALEDVQDAMAFIRRNHKKYGIDPDKIIAIGSSAGAQLGFSSYLSNPRELDSISHYRPNYIIGYSPVLRNDSLGYAYDLIKDDYSWFSPFNVYKDTDAHLPPTLIISGTLDHHIQLRYLQEFKSIANVKKDNLKLYSVTNAEHTMKNSYDNIYLRSVPLLWAFFQENGIETNSIFVLENGDITAPIVDPPSRIALWIERNWGVSVAVLATVLVLFFKLKKTKKNR